MFPELPPPPQILCVNMNGNRRSGPISQRNVELYHPCFDNAVNQVYIRCKSGVIQVLMIDPAASGGKRLASDVFAIQIASNSHPVHTRFTPGTHLIHTRFTPDSHLIHRGTPDLHLIYT
jgi:hypothetical protein